MKFLFQLVLIILIISVYANAQTKTPPSFEDSKNEPVKYIGKINPDKKYFDGNLPHAVGVHHYQVYRANRQKPLEGDTQGWTYNHQPFLSYWKGKFYVQYLSDLYQEHTPPGKTLIVVSENGRDWSKPKVAFPDYTLPEIKFEEIHLPAGTKAVMHQRMGFYVAPNGKLLTLAFYSYCPSPRYSPNAGNGLGRVVREIKKDGSFGPIYFIRYNRHAGWNESNTNYPFYKTSNDKEFLEACEALLADKLITLQWWEEDRAKDGFYPFDPGDVKNAAYFSRKITTSKGAGKAFNFFKRSDGIIVGLWKNKYSSLSPDNGKTWSKISLNKTLLTDGSKTWGQQTTDGKFVIIHNQSATSRNRFPMTSITSYDGHIFNDMLCLRGEVPLKRYQGLHKRIGPQYYRGIIPGNGNPPGDHVWVVYSLNKEDIYIARVRVPIEGHVKMNVAQDFENLNNVMDLEMWTLFSTQWAPSNIIKDPFDKTNSCLELVDEDPYDYAKVERIFPESKNVKIKFRTNMLEVPMGQAMYVEVLDQKGNRPVELRFGHDWLNMDKGRQKVNAAKQVKTGIWYDVELDLSTETQSYCVTVDGEVIGTDIKFDVEVESLERIEFRTGPYRGMAPPLFYDRPLATAGYETENLPGSEVKTTKSVYLIDDVFTKEN
ncbi:hypothetical protein ACFLTH_05095 [Bacteroidota bacterium]